MNIVELRIIPMKSYACSFNIYIHTHTHRVQSLQSTTVNVKENIILVVSGNFLFIDE
jgi:hypothetical protein